MHLSSLPVALAALCGFCCMATDDGQFHLEKRVPPAVVSLPFDLTSPHGPSVPAAESGDGLRKRDSKTYREVINNEVCCVLDPGHCFFYFFASSLMEVSLLCLAVVGKHDGMDFFSGGTFP